ncbi:peptidase M48, Ste24p [Acidovorax delafieldii 2AN]|uniref:Peptidase M48, Ste24p n=1 Tax=Acidovorax delafieldii 2AN TaxID=573060 RepID=C5TBR7_ACIDE|nr:peptidase M48, Ste24p [Acidovorax delafieldii 2AN]
MLLVDVEGAGALERWLDSHPTLAERIQRIYGRSMQPLPLTPVHEAPEAPEAATARPPLCRVR